MDEDALVTWEAGLFFMYVPYALGNYLAASSCYVPRIRLYVRIDHKVKIVAFCYVLWERR